MKNRNILWGQVEMTIEDGTVEDAPGNSNEGNIRYRLDMPGVDLLVAVDTTKGTHGKIMTTFYDDEQGAEGGALGGGRFGGPLGLF